MNEEKLIDHNSRQAYLKSMGLTLDPFSAASVAELELAFGALSWEGHEPQAGLIGVENRPSFYAHLVSLPPPEGLQTMSEYLKGSQSTIIYGESGSGKTALRLMLEADCRDVFDQALVVSYSLTPNALPKTEVDQRQQLAENIATDLFIQVIENYTFLEGIQKDFPTESQIEILRKQIAIGGQGLKRLARRMYEELQSPTAMSISRLGLGSFWPSVGKPAVRYVVPSEEITQLLERVLDAPSTQPSQESQSDVEGGELFDRGVQAAKTLGFNRILILVDGNGLTDEELWQETQSLIETIPEFEHSQIFLKLFLPSSLQARVNNTVQQRVNIPQEYTIRWNEELLRKVIRQRFRAAQFAWRTGMQDLAAQGFEYELDNRVQQTANGSPRRLLQVINALIDTVVARGPINRVDALISPSDWNAMCQNWQVDDGFPPPQPISPT